MSYDLIYFLKAIFGCFFFFNGSKNGVIVEVYWNIWSLLVLKLREDLLYACCAWNDQLTGGGGGRCQLLPSKYDLILIF